MLLSYCRQPATSLSFSMLALCGLGISNGCAMWITTAHSCTNVYNFFNKNNNIAVVMFVIISDVYTLRFVLLENLANGTCL